MISKGIRTFWGHHNHELPWDSRVIGTADFKFEAKFSESINFRVFVPSHLLSWSGGSMFFCWHRFVSLSLDDARNRVGLEVTIQFESWAKLNMHENITHLFDLAQDSIWIMTPPCRIYYGPPAVLPIPTIRLFSVRPHNGRPEQRSVSPTIPLFSIGLCND